MFDPPWKSTNSPTDVGTKTGILDRYPDHESHFKVHVIVGVFRNCAVFYTDIKARTSRQNNCINSNGKKD